MGKYHTPRQWGKCIRGVAYKNKYRFQCMEWNRTLSVWNGIRMHRVKPSEKTKLHRLSIQTSHTDVTF